MSTPAQMATMATYSIALLSAPPLRVLPAARRAPGGPAADSTGLGCGHAKKRAHVTQSNS